MSADHQQVGSLTSEPFLDFGNMAGQWFGSSYSNDFKTTTVIVVSIPGRHQNEPSRQGGHDGDRIHGAGGAAEPDD